MDQLVVFRCDASKTIGGGHVVRCMALAQALYEEGWSVGFAIGDETLAIVPDLGRCPYKLVSGFGLDFKHDMSLFENNWPDCDLAVIDHYRLDIEYEKALRGWAGKRLVIDDLASRLHDCEFLCDQTFGRIVGDYEKLVPADCHVMAGSRYALLRADFASARHHLDPLKGAGSVRHLLVSPGMSDVGNISQTILAGVKRSEFTGDVTIVLGGSSPNLQVLRGWLAAHMPGAQLLTSIDGATMASLLAKADLAIGAAGGSSYERGCLGVPALVVQLADNQRDNIEGLEAVGAIRSLGSSDELEEQVVCAEINALMSSGDRLLKMAKAATALTDGCGPQRLTVAVRPERASDGEPVILRAAELADAELLYEWQQQPETRRYALNPQMPPFDQHEKWLNGKLQDPACLFSIVIYGGQPAGMVRLDKVAPSLEGDEAYEISILISNQFYRRKLASAALSLASRLVPGAEIQAVILPQNEASLRLFGQSGYEPYENRFRLAGQRRKKSTTDKADRA